MSEAHSTTTSHITVIDDDVELLKLMILLLRRIGAQPTTIANGQEALDYLESNIPNLIILDLMLPGVNGFDILRRIRGDPRFDAVPVLVLSAKVDPQTIRAVLDAGADGYVTKPYIANSFIDRVRLLLTAGRQVAPPEEPPTSPT